MLREFAELLNVFLIREIPALAKHLFFDPPSQAFVQQLPADKTSLDVYLVDVRENRRLRTTERTRHRNGSTIVESRPPTWIDAHYLISAWDPSRDASDTEKTLREHELLQTVAAALFGKEPLTPLSVHTQITDPLLKAWPVDFRNTELPFQILPPEGFNRLSDFWTSMGQGSAWRPVIYLIVTLPLAMPDFGPEPMITTMLSKIGQRAGARDELIPGTERTWAQIGGFVLRDILDENNRPVRRPVKKARVILEIVVLQQPPLPPKEPVLLQSATTGDDGRYQFVRTPLPFVAGAQQFQMRVLAPGQPAKVIAPFIIPSSSGVYDIVL